MSVDDNALDRLCERYGIAVRYRDFWQHEHAAPESTKRALLAAMGVSPGTTPDEAGPTLVCRVGEAPETIELALGTHAPEATLHWQLALEDGGRHDGACVRVDGPDGSQARVRCERLPTALPPGYHRLVVTDARAGGVVVATAPLIVCPARCHPAPPGRRFGPTVQLYALRSRRNWGIGDFTDLRQLMEMAAREGADFVGVNPLHALFPVRPADASPYSPSSRLALNPLYLDVEALEDYSQCAAARAHVATAAFQERLEALRAAPLVDYPGVAAAKLSVLAEVFEHFRLHHLETLSERGLALRAFAGAHPDLAYSPALFDALHASLVARDANAWGWPAWPPEYRDHDADAVHAFAHLHRRDVDFFLYLQWQADRQLTAVAEAARAAGMAIGLYRDLAVGANPGGAETWQSPERFAMDVHVGAPPDEFNRGGQDWGLPPWIPHRLSEGDYAPWVALLRANMRHAGALRIDHVMGLLRLFWIPAGAAPADGTYVGYPLDDLLAILALESTRNACMVVGEDLGTVPEAVRSALHAGGVLSYRVLFFERTHEGAFAPPASYPAHALCSVTTHDLPTLEGFWRGADIDARATLALFPHAAVRDAQYDGRAADRRRLLQALVEAGLAPHADVLPSTLASEVSCAVHAYLARTPCALMAVQLEDVFAQVEQVNLPATTSEGYPNWRRKVGVALEDWAGDARFAAVCAAIRAQGRGRPGTGARDGAPT